jgi:ribosomal protein L34E
MIRSRSERQIKVKTPGNRVLIRYKKISRKSLLKLHPKIKREFLKIRARL